MRARRPWSVCGRTAQDRAPRSRAQTHVTEPPGYPYPRGSESRPKSLRRQRPPGDMGELLLNSGLLRQSVEVGEDADRALRGRRASDLYQLLIHREPALQTLLCFVMED
jgi:hypothetical protein